MVHISSIVVLACSLAVAIASPYGKRDVPQIEKDIDDFTVSLNNLHTAMNNLPANGGPGAIAQVPAIINAAVGLDSQVKKGTADVKSAGVISEADGTAILQKVEALEPTVADSVNAIVAKKAAFQSIPFGTTIVRANLMLFKNDTNDLTTAFVGISPTPALVAKATALRDQVASIFDAAIKAYS